MRVRRWIAVLTCASALAVATPGRAEAASPASLLSWISRTVAGALEAIAGNGSDLQPGGALALDRSVGTLVGGLHDVAPALDGLDVDLDLDREFRTGVTLGMTKPLEFNDATRVTLDGSMGYGAGGTLRQSLEVAFRRTPRERRHSYGKGGVPGAGAAAIGVAREEDPATRRIRRTLDGRVRWEGLQVGGRLRSDHWEGRVRPGAAPPIDAARVEFVANLPRLTWAKFETRHAWSPAARGGRLLWAMSDYAVELRPLGPLELTAGHRLTRILPARWYTSLRFKMALGGST